MSMSDAQQSPNLIHIAATTIGTTLGGPAGAAVGSAIGLLLSAVLPAPADISANLAAGYAQQHLERIYARARRTWSGEGEARKLVNHDLQDALRDALSKTVVDIGGPECFENEWKKRQSLPVPQQDLAFFHTGAGRNLVRENPPLADQACSALRKCYWDLAEHRLLPLVGGGTDGTIDVYSLLLMNDPSALADHFYEIVGAPYLSDFGKGLGIEAREVERFGFASYLRQHLFPQTLFNLGELLKDRTPAWRAFNRWILEDVRDGLLNLSTTQQSANSQILERLDALLAQKEGSLHLQTWIDNLADLLAALGQIELEQEKGFDQIKRLLRKHAHKLLASQEEILALIQNNHQELLSLLHAHSGHLERMEGKLDVFGSPAATSAHTSIHVNVPGKLKTLVGRDELVTGLVERLKEGRDLALVGLPGVGKTSLAVTIAHQSDLLAHYSDGVLWGSLGPQPDVQTILVQWGDALGRDVSQIGDTGQRVQAIRSAIGMKRVLLIIEDGWHQDAIETLRCGGPNCVHLLTTRDQDLAFEFAGPSRQHFVPLLDDDAAFELLSLLAPKACSVAPDLARRLLRVVDNLPLAVELLGNYLGATRHRLSARASQQALKQLDEPKQRLELAQRRLGQLGSDQSLRQTILLSLEDLPLETRSAFYALGAFAPSPARFEIDAALAVIGADDSNAIADLLRRSLLLQDEDEWLLLHQTVADVAREQMPPDAVMRHYTYHLALIKSNVEDWQRIEAVYEQIRYLAYILPPGDELDRLCAAAYTYQYRRGLWKEREEWLLRILGWTQETRDRKNESNILGELGNMYADTGNWGKAIEVYTQSLPVCREFGDRDGEAALLANLGTVYANQSKWDEAKELYEQSLAIDKERNNLEGEASTCNSLAAVYYHQGRWKEAEELYEKSISISQELGDGHSESLVLSNLAELYDGQGRWDDAIQILEQALSISKKLGDRNIESHSFNSMAAIYSNQGRWNEAEQLYKRSLALRREFGDPQGESFILNNLGHLYIHLGRLEEATESLDRALTLSQKLGDRRVQGLVLNSLGQVYSTKGKWQESFEYYSQGLRISESIGDLHTQSFILNNLAVISIELGYWTESLELCNQSMTISRELGDHHLEGIALSNLGEVHRRWGKHEEARRYYKAALEKMHPQSPLCQAIREVVEEWYPDL
jgi:tetratricopeptide (TPR) repeat protein